MDLTANLFLQVIHGVMDELLPGAKNTEYATDEVHIHRLDKVIRKPEA